MNQKKLYEYFVIVLLLLNIPALYYAFGTDFGLIDDMSDWKFINLDFNKFISDNFLSFETTRFRPTWELYNWFTWSTFGTSSFLHHLLRILIKIGIIGFSYGILKTIFTKKNDLRLSCFVFLSVFIFFPINPEVRLAPVELQLIFFFSGLSFFLTKVHKYHNGDIFQNKSLYALSIIFYFFLLGSKEVSLPFLLAFLIILLVRNQFSFSSFIKLVPFIIIFCFGVLKIYLTAKNASYGKAPLNSDLIYANWTFIKKFVLLTTTSDFIFPFLLIPFVFLLYRVSYFLYLNKLSFFPKSFFLSVFESISKSILSYYFLCFIGIFLLTLTFWVPALRYYYPLMFVWVLLLSLSVGMIYRLLNSIWRKYFEVALISFSFFFCVNKLFQFSFTVFYAILREAERERFIR